MMNGKPGDAAFTDIVQYRLSVFHPKVDQLICEVDAAGGFDHALAEECIELAHRVWRNIACFLSPDRQNDQAAVAVAAETWLRNLAFTLYLHLEALRGAPHNESLSLPEEWDPLV